MDLEKLIAVLLAGGVDQALIDDAISAATNGEAAPADVESGNDEEPVPEAPIPEGEEPVPPEPQAEEVIGEPAPEGEVPPETDSVPNEEEGAVPPLPPEEPVPVEEPGPEVPPAMPAEVAELINRVEEMEKANEALKKIVESLQEALKNSGVIENDDSSVGLDNPSAPSNTTDVDAMADVVAELNKRSKGY